MFYDAHTLNLKVISVKFQNHAISKKVTMGM